MLKSKELTITHIATEPSIQVTPKHATLEARILLEQLKFLYPSSLRGVMLYGVAGLALVYMQWLHIDHKVLIAWFSAMLCVVVFRIFLLKAFQKREATWQQAGYWRNLFLLGVIAGALVWGAAGIWLLPEDFLHLSLTAVVTLGVIAGSLATLSALRSAIFSFAVIAGTPLIISLFLNPLPDIEMLANVGVMYVVFIIIIAQSSYRVHLQNITLRLHTEDREKALLKSEHMILNTAEILRMIATGQPASDIFKAIALLYESRHNGLRCVVLATSQTDKQMPGNTQSLLKAYAKAARELRHGLSTNACGTTTYVGQRLLIEDVSLYADAREENDGQVLPMGCCWSEPILGFDGAELGAFGMYYDDPALPDADELKDLEAAARLAGIVMQREKRENLLRLHSNCLEQAREAILITNARGMIEYINEAYSQITGYVKEDLIGKNARVLKSGNQDQQFYKDLWQTISKGKVWSHKLIEKRKDGSQYRANMDITPVKDKAGRIINYVAIHNDLSEIEALEDRFFQAQKLESVGVLVGGIAHDFNNILAAIKGNVYLANMNIANQVQVQKKLNTIDILSERAAEMTYQLLTYARKDRVEMKPIYLNKFIAEAFKLARTHLPENIEHACTICDEKLYILGDKKQLQQVLMNLFNNACDAVAGVSKPNIECEITFQDMPLEMQKKNPNHAEAKVGVIKVRDNGCGISSDAKSNIFEPFFTTKEVGQGTGLGLSMVYGSIQRHEGMIEVESQLGVSTCFSIFLPLTKDFVEKEEAEIIVYGKKEKILLVDDDDAMRETTAEVLRDLHYDVLEAENGAVALDIFKEHSESIALVLTDVMMPQVGGIALVKAIRVLNAEVPVIFVTGYDKQKIMTDDPKIAHSKVLLKPFSFEALSQTLSHMLKRGNA